MTFPTYNARNDHSILGRWWDEVDRSQIWTVLLILLSGWIVMFTGSAQEALQGDQPLLNFSAKKFQWQVATRISTMRKTHKTNSNKQTHKTTYTT